MAINLARTTRIALTVLVLAAYPLLAHFGSVSSIDSWLAVAMAAGPVMVLVIIHVGIRYRTHVLLASGLVIAYLLLHRAVISENLGWVYLAQHAGTNGILCFIFGRSLRAGRTPLVSRMATMIEGGLQPEVERYTRQVTYAWTLFFGLTAIISTLLFFLGPLVVWSVFANILYMPSVLVMFGVEYLVRVLILPRSVHTNLFATLQSAWKTFASPRS